MTTHRTADLIGAYLDAAVALAEFDIESSPHARYSTSWADAGPIIERAQIVFRHHEGGVIEACVMTGEIGVNRKRQAVQKGPSILVASMRAFVAFKFGDAVELPA